MEFGKNYYHLVSDQKSPVNINFQPRRCMWGYLRIKNLKIIGRGKVVNFRISDKFPVAATWLSRVIVKVPCLEHQLRLFERFIRRRCGYNGLVDENIGFKVNK